jgi:hypothetical protein
MYGRIDRIYPEQPGPDVLTVLAPSIRFCDTFADTSDHVRISQINRCLGYHIGYYSC